MDREHLTTLACYYTQDHSANKLRSLLSHNFPGVPIMGASTCKGVMTEKGVHFGCVIGIMAIYDSGISSYGTATVTIAPCDNVTTSTQLAIEKALEKADRVGEVPGFVLLHATPGLEEKIIACIDDTFHTQVPIIGGSSADNHIKGHWSIFNEDLSTVQGVALQVFFPSSSLSTGFSAGYSPTEFVGTVTRANQRELLEIDHIPAQQIYREWVCDHAGVEVPKHFVFELVTKYPLGRIAGSLYEQPYYKLSHPISFSEEQGLLLFSDISEGDQVTLMSGDRDKLVGRATRVLKEAQRNSLRRDQIAGALSIFCAGPMLYLGEDIHRVQSMIVEELGDTPFICPFTFGEQGRFIGGENAHGNLMISSVVFYS
ncbi:FIST signal transduction protein [Vibrio paucivorans]|uniref:FIST signal transduction protein n=1 Tax=Vibrio paucivorans TaxID=2829489 RepID=UPI0028C3A47D|nr:FIST N-terminal domain-containing protein [Vibrio paucivorans]